MIPRFRAWDKDEKVMRSWENLILEKTDRDDFWLIGYRESRSIISYDHDQILMQSTGLKDKDGVEIFEGDIFHEGYATYAVCWNDKDVCFSLRCHGEDFTLPISMRRSMTLVGNIYENPDLLEANK